MSANNQSQYVKIPFDVLHDTRLSANTKLLYGEISSLCHKLGYSWASNSYFAKTYKVRKETISIWINSLIKHGYLESKIVYRAGTKEILNRYLEIKGTGIVKNLNRPIKEILKENTITNNSKSNNDYEIKILK